MKRILLSSLLVANTSLASIFTDFYITPSGGHTNSGHTEGGPIANFVNGGWSTVTYVYTCPPGSDLSGVTNGGWLSVYNDGATVGTFSGYVTNVDDTADTISLNLGANRVFDSVPTTSVTARSAVFGGAWNFPNGTSSDYPFSGLRGESVSPDFSSISRLNIKSNIYVTTGLIGSFTYPGRIQGYDTITGDGGRPIIRPNAGAAFVMMTISSAGGLYDLIFDASNFTSGTSAGITGTTRDRLYRVTVIGAMGSGIFLSSGDCIVVECEAFGNGRNAVGHGFSLPVDSMAINCIAHHNVHSGFSIAGGALFNCISYENGSDGFASSVNLQNAVLVNCDSYNNATNGFSALTTQGVYWHLVNCNAFANGEYGLSAVGQFQGQIDNFMVGSGTMTNDFGTLSSDAVVTFGTNNFITYPADTTPWVDPDIGNFSLRRTANSAIAAGRGFFPNTTNTSLTIGYPDLGAAQSSATNATSGGGSFTFGQ